MLGEYTKPRNGIADKNKLVGWLKSYRYWDTPAYLIQLATVRDTAIVER